MEAKNIIEFARFLWGDGISEAQLTLLKCLYGMPLSWQERALWRRFCEKQVFARYKPTEYDEALCLLGRQSGKSSRIGTTVALYEALAVEREIPPGSRLAVLFFAPTLRQSTFDQVAEKLRSIPEFAELIENDAAASGEIRLTNQVDLVSFSANPRTARGRTAVLAVVDEAAYIRTDSSFEMNLPELLESIRPSLIVQRGKLLLLSSPSGKEGPLFTAYEQRGDNPDVLVWRAPSQAMNPAIDEKLLEREKRRGDSYYRREYCAEFVDSLSPFIPTESLEAAIRKTPAFERNNSDPFVCAGIDLADKRDDCALSISSVRNVEGKNKVALLFAKAWKPTANGHNVVKILEEMGQICRDFRVTKARGDQKSMSTAEHILGQFGIGFERVITDGAGSEQMYRTFLATLNNGDVLLPEHDELLTQLRRLEEKTTDGNRFRVAGRRNSKDDLAVSAVLSIATAAERLMASPMPSCGGVFAYEGGTGESDDRYFCKQRERIPSFARQRY